MTESAIEGVGATLTRLGRAFAARDVGQLKGVYTPDAEWMNAFGTRKRGGAEIVAYLRELFADPHFSAGTPVGPPTAEIRLIAEGVAVAWTSLEIEGQQRADGGVLPRRRNHSLKVLSMQPDGRWQIASEMYMDARDEVTHAPRS